MSERLVVPVAKLQNIRPHPNADRLELADVLGYQMVIPKDVYKDGDVVIYIPADACIPADLADEWEVRNYLKGKDRDRVGRVRLRGEPSFGLIIRPPENCPPVGTNMAEHYGVWKYEPPIRPQDGDAAARDPIIDPLFQTYTDIENGRIFVDVFQEGEPVVATEKIHGMNNRVGIIRDPGSDIRYGVAGTHRVRRKPPEVLKNHKTWHAWSIPEVEAMLNKLADIYKVVILYGEIFGGSVQSPDYGVPKGTGVGYRAFDLLVDGRYMDYDEFKATCENYEVGTVPEVYRGPFKFEEIKEIADGQTLLTDGQIREGVVVRPLKERQDHKIGRAIVKVVGTQYSLSKKSDFKDV